MIPSSGNYSFQTIRAELLIREAFELIGINGSLLVVDQLEGAARSINFLVADLVNQNVNLWTLKQIFLPLNPEQTSYYLPADLIKVIQVDLRTSTRELFGTATASEGIAANAFDDNPATSCLQTNINGWIGYQFSTAQKIKFLGISSMVTKSYTIIFEGSQDGNNWITISSLPQSSYSAGLTIWTNIYNTNDYLFYRIRETGGAVLNICELYFNDQVVDTPLTEITNYEYNRFPIKNNVGRPTIFSVDYQIIPQLNIWQAPDVQYNCLLITYQSMIETLTSYTESINIPNSFYQAIVYGLAKSLSLKYAPDKLQFISPEFDRIIERAIVKNTNTLPISFKINVN